MQPIIGITAGKEKSDTNIQKITLIDKYVEAILHAGGIPLIIPAVTSKDLISSIFQKIDGVLLTGGGDIETLRYNGENHPRVYGVDVERDQLEIDLVLSAVTNKKPLLGICRGIQIINVALGGDLYSDISDQRENSLRHDWFPDYPRDMLAHEVLALNNSRLHEITGCDQMKVNSLHHQGIRSIAPGLTATAFAEDGIIEAVEMDDHPFFLGVQWHPEWIYNQNTTKQIFKTFIQTTIKNG